jgi:hypothetical protein
MIRVMEGKTPAWMIGAAKQTSKTLVIVCSLLGVCSALLIGQSATARPLVTSIVLTPRGFEPAAIALKAGSNRLVIYNRSGGRTNNFQLSLSQGNSPAILVDQSAMVRYQIDLARDLVLAAGSYILVDLDHAAWKCAIVVK